MTVPSKSQKARPDTTTQKVKNGPIAAAPVKAKKRMPLISAENAGTTNGIKKPAPVTPRVPTRYVNTIPRPATTAADKKSTSVTTTAPQHTSTLRKSAITKKVLSRVMQPTTFQKQYRKEIKKEQKKAVFNGRDITTINVDEYFQYEYLYFRDMELTTLDCASLFPNLRLVDLSSNQISNLEFLQNMPALHHLSISSNALTKLDTLPAELTELESLVVGNNRIRTLQGMPALENLRVLSLQSNLIDNLNGLPFSLDTLDLRENPIVVDLGSKQLRDIIVGLHGFAPLKRVNGQRVNKVDSDKDRNVKKRALEQYGGKIAYCIREGYLPPTEGQGENAHAEGDNTEGDSSTARAEEDFTTITAQVSTPTTAGLPHSAILQQASTHLIRQQLEKTDNLPLRLYYIGLTADPSEGNPISLMAIFKLMDPSLNIIADGFTQHTFENDQTELEYLVINDQHIPMDKGLDDKLRCTLLLPLGEYEFGYSALPESDSLESASVITLSEPCGNLDTEDTDLYLFLQWFKLDAQGLFQEIANANDVSLVPQVHDIGANVKAQLFCFDAESNLLFSVFDISDKIQEAVPQCRSLSIEGALVEGNTIVAQKEYFGGVEGDSKFQWIGANDRLVDGPEYELKLSDVEHRVRLQYTPVRVDGVQGQPVTVESDIVEPAEPRIVDLVIQGDAKEGESVSVAYTYYGGFEGESAIQWMRQNTETGLFQPVVGETDRLYKVSLSDVHHVLQVCVTPINDKGHSGEDATFATPAPVVASEPRAMSLAITALKLEEDKIVVVEAEYHGGYEGKSLVEWYRISKNVDNGEEIREHIAEASQQQMYKCTFDDVGHKLEVEYTPKREDGILGEPVRQQTDGVIRSGPPKCSSIHIVGDLVQDAKVGIEYEYKGGIEGSSMVRWYRVAAEAVQDVYSSGSVGGEENGESGQNEVDHNHHDDESHLHDGELVGKGYEYKITLGDTAHRLRVEYTPVRDDGVQGELVHAFTEVIHALPPVLSNVHMSGDFNEYEKVSGSADYFGGYEQVRRHKWIRVIGEGDGHDSSHRIQIQDASEDSYIIDTADVGHRLIYTVQSISTEGIESDWVETEPSTIIQPQQPTISGAKLIGSPQEEGCIRLEVEGEDFDQELSTVEWVRIKEGKEDDADQTSSSTKESPLTPSSKWSYNITLHDIGYSIACRFTPVRGDLNISGETLFLKTDPVSSGEPTIESFQLKGKPMEGHTLRAQYHYTGGREGNTQIKWYRIGSSSTREMTDFNNTTEYPVSVEDLDARIKCEVTPMRFDGVEGIPQGETSAVVRGGEPSVFNVEILGDAAEGKTLRARHQYYGGIEGDSQKRWYRVTSGSEADKEVVSLNDEYAISLDDIDHYIQFEYIPIRQDGVRGVPEIITTKHPVRANPATISQVQIVGNSQVSEKLSVTGQYTGGKEGLSVVEWHVSASRSGPWTAVASAPGKSTSKDFYPTVDELNQFVRATYTPVRLDGVSGAPVESQLVQIHMGATHLQNLTEAVQQSQVTLMQCNPVIVLSHKQLLLTDEAKKNVLKSSFEKGLVILNDAKNENQFFVRPAPKQNAPSDTIALQTTSRNERDFAVLVCRLFVGFADQTLTEDVYGKPFAQAWKKKKNVSNALETAQQQVAHSEKPQDLDMALVYEVMRALLSQDM
eukprot:CAMPEP_0117449212 /NCGR_PEP_ID=MMETSP0759-20121206/7825_1 /TAXON_ID=63605 /ORGANISM="Percolomonas cosmopolitus, Strain WS" /LENGTH=1654 /DNA_ID=CAMNT_0005241673 /DNA_START=190 /DNA_END=5154 /DNA_ORIENTATION=-